MIIIFIAGTVVLIFFTWVFSLKERRYHGIFRFFAFESILALVLLNTEVWFKNLLSAHQIISWISLSLSLFLAIHGFYLLKKAGKPEDQIENTTRLVTRGAYKYIRHPLYASLIFGGIGIFVKNITAWTCGLVVLDILALYLTARVEEKEMIAKFGGEYRAYMTTTKMFIPFLV